MNLFCHLKWATNEGAQWTKFVQSKIVHFEPEPINKFLFVIGYVLARGILFPHLSEPSSYCHEQKNKLWKIAENCWKLKKTEENWLNVPHRHIYVAYFVQFHIHPPSFDELFLLVTSNLCCYSCFFYLIFSVCSCCVFFSHWFCSLVFVSCHCVVVYFAVHGCCSNGTVVAFVTHTHTQSHAAKKSDLIFLFAFIFAWQNWICIDISSPELNGCIPILRKWRMLLTHINLTHGISRIAVCILIC